MQGINLYKFAFYSNFKIQIKKKKYVDGLKKQFLS